MPRLFTMDALVLACQQQVDLENHSVISATEWKGFVSRAYGELWTIVYESGLQHFEKTATLTTTGAVTLDEPSDMLSVVALVYVVNATTGQYADVREAMPQERAGLSGMSGDRAQYYCLVSNKLYLYPTPPTGQAYELRYVQQSPDLTTLTGTDTVDVVTPDGHDFLIWSVAVRAMGKTEADPQLALREREDARKRFTKSVQLRALMAARRVVVQPDDFGPRDLDW